MNKWIGIGIVGKDPETKVFGSGDKIVNFSLATSENWKDKNGEKQQSTEWHNIIASKKVAELVEKYVKKGSKLMVSGKIKQRSWDSDNGKKYITEIHISEIEFLSKSTLKESKPESKASENKSEIEEPNVDNNGLNDDLPF